MNFLSLLSNWKDLSAIWSVIHPFVLKLLQKKVPASVTRLYENIAKVHEPLINSLHKLKNKIKETPNQLDDECFNIGVSTLEAYNIYLTEEIKKLKE